MGKLSWTILLGAIAMGVYLYTPFFRTPATPPKMEDGWWGRGMARKDDATIKPFTVKISDDVLKDLDSRLKMIRWGEDLEKTQFQYGFQVNYMKEVVQHWKQKFDWRKQEKKINQFPQFKTQIEGIDVHFLHVKPASGKPGRPLMIVHGWPGSIWEFSRIIPMLTNPEKYGGKSEEAFEVICPSIPGYGFSEATHQQGFYGADAARMFKKLMDRLGHNKYYIQGGDWGALITEIMIHAYPSRILGLHTNLVQIDPGLRGFVKQFIGMVFPSLVGLSENDVALWYPMLPRFSDLIREMGYMHLQATKPDTVAFGLNDSPVGLAAYILEKYSCWTNPEWRDLPDGGLTKKFTLDDLLTNVMIYWVNGNIGPSMRFYKENFAIHFSEVVAWTQRPVSVPVGLARFPYDLSPTPRAFAENKYRNIVQFTEMPTGGHFASLEEPQLMAEDIRSFVQKVEELSKIKP